MNELNLTANLALTSFGFLVPRNTRVTTRQLAATIRSGHDSVQAVAVADELEGVSGIFDRTWSGLQYEKMSDKNKYEIAVRNAGYEVRPSVDPDSIYVQLVETATGNRPAGPHYLSPELAWEAAATDLRVDPDVSFYYGPLRADESDRNFLESLGVELGGYDRENGTFIAKLSLCALHELAAQHGDCKFDRLTPLSCEIKVKKQLFCEWTCNLPEMKRADLIAYGDYLAFELSRYERDPVAFATSWRMNLGAKCTEQVVRLGLEQTGVKSALAALDAANVATQSPSSSQNEPVSGM